MYTLSDSLASGPGWEGSGMNSMALARPRNSAEPGERDIARLLARRYGDGTVYVPSGEGMGLFHACMALGFVSTDGVITSKGRRLLTRYTD